jgi:RNA polymerase sigma-70 factor (ECF subfamily)
MFETLACTNMRNPWAATSEDSACGGGRFERTRWTLILKARDEAAPGAAEAIEQFARNYWPPLYRFIRRQGYSRHDAEDLTQGFYSHFLNKRLLDRVTERQGKFRNFLLACLKHFLSDERDRAGALKRGGDRSFISLDALEAEERDAVESADSMTADQIYERRWACELFARAQQRLRKEYHARGRAALYESLRELPFGGEADAGYAEIAARLGMSKSAINSAAHQLRKSYQRILREEIGRTVSRREEIDEEIRYLIGLLAS